MINLLTTVSGYFSRSLILGAFLPTIIFIILFVVLIEPLLPSGFTALARLSLLETEWKLLWLTFVTIVLSGFLYNLNNPIIRLYEGYPWKETGLGKWLIRRKRENFRRLKAFENGLQALLIALEDADEALKRETVKRIKDQIEQLPYSTKKTLSRAGVSASVVGNDWQNLKAVIEGAYNDLSLRVINNFPEKEGLILPTSLGNVVRSFEYYPTREYRIDAVTLYPRLVAKIDKEYALVIDDAKTSFDFMVNCSLLSNITAFLLLVLGTGFSKPFVDTPTTLVWLFEIMLFMILGAVFYKGAINQAYGWGDTVKSAFDLYRNPLLEQLGYDYVPSTRVEETALWEEISLQMIYGNPTEGPPTLVYKKAAPPAVPVAAMSDTHVSGLPDDVKLTVFKSVSFAPNDNLFSITIDVINEDEAGRFAGGIILTDTVPAGWFCRRDSVNLFIDGRSSDAAVDVKGTNPYNFALGALGCGEKKTISYQILPLQNEAQKEEEKTK